MIWIYETQEGPSNKFNILYTKKTIFVVGTYNWDNSFLLFFIFSKCSLPTLNEIWFEVVAKIYSLSHAFPLFESTTYNNILIFCYRQKKRFKILGFIKFEWKNYSHYSFTFHFSGTHPNYNVCLQMKMLESLDLKAKLFVTTIYSNFYYVILHIHLYIEAIQYYFNCMFVAFSNLDLDTLVKTYHSF